MADTKITGYTEDTAPASDSLVETVDDPGGTPANRKTTLANLIKGLILSNATSKSSPVAEDTLVLDDSEASNVAKSATLAELNPAINSQITTNAETASFTFALTDRGKITTASNASAQTATVPPNSSVAFPTGTILALVQIGAGAFTWTAGGGVTLNYNTSKYASLVTNGQYSLSFARKTATDTWEVYGDLVPYTAGDTLAIFTPLSNEPPTSNFATFDTRNNHPVLDFDASTNESAIFSGYMPRSYGGNGVTVYIGYSMTSATSGDVDLDVAFERIGDQQLDVDSDSFAAVNSVDNTTVPATSGNVDVVSVAFTDGADMDSVAAGDLFRIQVTRDATNDTATGDLELHFVEIRETP